jgi:hypothetical protein
MSVKGWEFSVNPVGRWFYAKAEIHTKTMAGKLNGTSRDSETEAQADLADLERRVLAFELAGRGFDTLKMMAVSATLSSGQSTLEELDAAQVIMDAFYSALAEIEGDKE